MDGTRDAYGACTVIDCVNRLWLDLDLRDWERVREALWAAVYVDAAVLCGAPAHRLSADQLIASWQRRYAAVTTQHMVAGHVVTCSDAGARCRAQLQLQHYAPSFEPDGTWTVGGVLDLTCRHDNTAWRVTELVFTELWDRGNAAHLAAPPDVIA